MGWGKEEEERKKEKKWYRYNGTTPRWCSAPAADGQTNWFFPLSLGLSLIFSVYMIFRDRNLLVRDIWSSTVISNQPTAPLLLLASLSFFRCCFQNCPCLLFMHNHSGRVQLFSFFFCGLFDGHQHFADDALRPNLLCVDATVWRQEMSSPRRRSRPPPSRYGGNFDEGVSANHC